MYCRYMYGEITSTWSKIYSPKQICNISTFFRNQSWKGQFPKLFCEPRAGNKWWMNNKQHQLWIRRKKGMEFTKITYQTHGNTPRYYEYMMQLKTIGLDKTLTRIHIFPYLSLCRMSFNHALKNYSGLTYNILLRLKMHTSRWEPPPPI